MRSWIGGALCAPTLVCLLSLGASAEAGRRPSRLETLQVPVEQEKSSNQLASQRRTPPVPKSSRASAAPTITAAPIDACACRSQDGWVEHEVWQYEDLGGGGCGTCGGCAGACSCGGCAPCGDCGPCGGGAFSCGGYAVAEYINWQPRRRGLDFAIADPRTAATVGGRLIELSLGRESGFRTGFGYRTADGWDVGIKYTMFHSDDDGALAGNRLLATQSHPAARSDPLTSESVANLAEASASLKYDTFDIEIGHWFDVNDAMFVRLYGGVRGAMIDQDLRIGYDGEDFNNATISAPVDFDGVGLRVGAETHWNVGCGFSVFGRVAGSLLAGDFRLRRIETENSTVLVNLVEDYHETVPVTEIALGAQVQRGSVFVQTGYELSSWYNMAERLSFHDNAHRGSYSTTQGVLGFDGFFVRVGIVR